MTPHSKISLIWFNWLLLVVLGVMVFGISMILAPGLMRQAFSFLLFADTAAIDSDFGATAVAYVTLIHGVLGGVMFGWGAALFLILVGPLRRGSREAWMLFAASLAAWYFPDTLFSLWTGYWPNAVLNSVLALLFAVPLAATFKTCRPEQV
jgi:hypothetical protein